MIEQPAVIRQIRDHLGLPTGAASLRAPPDQTDSLADDQARDWSYEPCLDLPVRRTQTGLPVRRTQTGNLSVPDPAIV